MVRWGPTPQVSSASLSSESSDYTASGSSGFYLPIWQWLLLGCLCCCCMGAVGGMAAGGKKPKKKKTKKKSTPETEDPESKKKSEPKAEEPGQVPVATEVQPLLELPPLMPSYPMVQQAPVTTAYAAPVTTAYAAPVYAQPQYGFAQPAYAGSVV